MISSTDREAASTDGAVQGLLATGRWVKERKGIALPSIPLYFFCAVDSRDSSLSSRSRSRGSFSAGYLLDRKAVGFGGRELLNEILAGFRDDLWEFSATVEVTFFLPFIALVSGRFDLAVMSSSFLSIFRKYISGRVFEFLRGREFGVVLEE